MARYNVSPRNPGRTRRMVKIAHADHLEIPKGLNVNSKVWGPAHAKLAREIQRKHHLTVTGQPTLAFRRFLFPKPKPTPKREKAVHAGMTQLGVHEIPPGSNGGGMIDQYEKAGEGRVIHESWCGDFVKWCSDQAGIKLPRFYYPRAVAWAENLPHVADYRKNAQLGDVVVFQWDNGEFHVARFLGWVQLPSGPGIRTLDGNASDQVGINERNIRFIHAIVRTPE